MSLLDALPYPFSDPTAQELHQNLCKLYSSVSTALFVAEAAGLDKTQLWTEQPVFYLWKEVLELAAKQSKLHDLVAKALERLGSTSPFRGFFVALLQDVPPPISEEPRLTSGAANFLVKTDEVFEQEALLYHDDLTLEIGRLPALVGTLQKLIALAPTVCKLNVDFNGRSKTGTAFRIGPDLLLTNWHVLHLTDTGAPASKVSAEFLYEDDGQGGVANTKIIRCTPSTIRTDKDDDWAVITVQDPLDAAWPIIDLDAAAPIQNNDPAYIIQHPAGARKRLGFVRNQISFFDERVVHYLTDTKAGSSGAPVFDGAGRLIALHHAGGRPQEIAGRAPLSKNEGIRISRVVEGLKP